MFNFKILKKSKRSWARLGVLETPHGEILTPAFIPVATQATVKSLDFKDLENLKTQVILCNTYHLYLRPGEEIIAKAGGLHQFMNWFGPMMTDSGGFQIFSLGWGQVHRVSKIGFFPGGEFFEEKFNQIKPKLVKITPEGVQFTSHLDGSLHFLTPEKSIKIQESLGADLIFAFDECTSPLASYQYTKEALERTHFWAKKCLKVKTRKDQALFGIVQGGEFRDLREESAKFISNLDFFGFGIGGALGKSKKDMFKILKWIIPLLTREKPRHLLGIGQIEDLKECVKYGIDLFDCVWPTRLARRGTLLTSQGKINIENKKYLKDFKPIEKKCLCFCCQNFTRSYLSHLYRAKELLAYRLGTLHNLYFVLKLMENLRKNIFKAKI